MHQVNVHRHYKQFCCHKALVLRVSISDGKTIHVRLMHLELIILYYGAMHQLESMLLNH